MKNVLDTFLHDNVALVTGAGSGIGRATAEKLAAVGARVGLFGRTHDELRDTADAIAKNGGNALVLEGDVTHADQLDNAVGAIEREWGRLDVLVCNAGINGKWAPLEELEESDWDKTIDINLKGTFLTVRAALPLLRRNGGSVTIVSSVNGTRMFSNAGASAYATSKAGQVAFARMMALELARLRVRVNTVCPGAIETAIDDNTQAQHTDELRPEVEFPEGKIPITGGSPGTVEQVAAAILFLSSPAASHITGAELFIDGAQSLLQG
ncbi:SDR family NAD(P)-dependent oxidoreductase [Opitutales bacterium ASA1]|uniref:SDR family oxidoreductase n=1 Tax=Congregicoccus parvus TaxID=3081749 RepID=UPI002B30804D|nr:SDR family NAD(P)-dependent oxidoreductase [Opitutales bacterium ASA1]